MPHVIDDPVTAMLLAALRRDLPAFTAGTASWGAPHWTALFNLAIEQRVQPQLLRVLSHQSDADQQGLRALRASCLRIAVRHLGLHRTLDEVVAALAAAGIPVLVLKGMHLVNGVYAQPALREMSDIDLMVRVEHLEAATEVLRSIGYQWSSEYSLAALLAKAHHLPLMRKPGAAAFELHWTIAPPDTGLAIEVAELWDRAVPIVIGRTRAWGLCPEDLLLHVSAHATHHHRMELGLRSLCDLAAIVDRFTLDWTVVGERAERWRCARGTFLALQLGAALIGVKVPAAILHRLHGPGPRRDDIVALTVTHMFSRSGAHLPHHISRLFGNGSLAQRWRTLWHQVLLPPEMLTAYYGLNPRARWPTRFAYQLRRALQLTRRHGASLLAMGGDAEGRRAVQRQNQLGDWLAARDPDSRA